MRKHFLVPHNITPWSKYSLSSKLLIANQDSISDVSSAAYPSANLAIYIPFYVEAPFVVDKLYWTNGAVVSGNVDAGIYDAGKSRLVSAGSTAQAVANQNQVVDVTNVTLYPGLFFLAIAMDNTTGTLLSLPFGSVAFAKTTGMYMQASAFPLPATATFSLPTADYVPIIGATPRSLVS